MQAKVWILPNGAAFATARLAALRRGKPIEAIAIRPVGRVELQSTWSPSAWLSK